ncbi:MAG TPA: hypothetical protein VJZ49_14060, partial [Syntrophales bacterium]|nr:hypothetical protein [Syntrophales bacterium]
NVHGGWRRLKSRSALTPKQSTEPPWYVIRMPGGVGGEGPRGPSLSRLHRTSKNEPTTLALLSIT